MLCWGFCCSSKPQSENERKQKDRQIVGSCQRALLKKKKKKKKKKKGKAKVGMIPIIIDVLVMVMKGLERKLEELEIRERLQTIVKLS